MAQQIQLDIKEYLKWKAAGTVALQKIGANTVFMVKDRWNSDTGEPEESATASVTVVLCDSEIERQQKAIDDATERLNAWKGLRADVIEKLTK